MDALVICPGNNQKTYQNLADDYSAIEPPIWGMLLTRALKAQGKTALLVDPLVENYTHRQIAEIVDDTQPKLIIITAYGQQPSASTQNMHAVSELCSYLWDRKHPILVVGGHPSALPMETLMSVKCDYVAKGEGINTALGLLNGVSKSLIPGLYYWENGNPHVGIKDKVSTDLQKVYPGFSWDQLPMHRYRAHNWHCFGDLNSRNSYASIYTSLGCPFKCTFCCINAPFDSNSFRYWDPVFMGNEIRNLVHKYGTKNLKIADEMFVLKDSHFLTLCEELIKHKLNLNIWAYARVDTVKPKYLETLKKAGVNWLALGIESGSKFVREGVTKGRFGMEEIKRTVETIKNANINVIGNYIFGLPDDTLSTCKETLMLAQELNCEMANFYCAMAYPGSELYTLTRKEDLPETYLGYSQHSYETKPLPTKTMSSGEVLKFRDDAFHLYFLDNGYLSMMERKFGLETRSHIEEMAKIRLERKFASR